ncbi:chromosome replication initiation inhibitor protein [Chromobacterium violaceum]|uniref:Chromosome replication initiation inhibitor protein n=1 Tax=Chromobacterium violaceum TaxID=536 RepID=A0A3S4LID0_CHRVL|nr:chromosome replication initiation inhibitor protein [Chromobacterium violaceum]
MIDELRALAVFAKTTETGSFRAAARALGLAPSVVSHHVSQLESRLGSPCCTAPPGGCR